MDTLVLSVVGWWARFWNNRLSISGSWKATNMVQGLAGRDSRPKHITAWTWNGSWRFLHVSAFVCVVIRLRACICIQKINLKSPDMSRHSWNSASRCIFCSKTFGMYYISEYRTVILSLAGNHVWVSFLIHQVPCITKYLPSFLSAFECPIILVVRWLHYNLDIEK